MLQNVKANYQPYPHSKDFFDFLRRQQMQTRNLSVPLTRLFQNCFQLVFSPVHIKIYQNIFSQMCEQKLAGPLSFGIPIAFWYNICMGGLML